MQIAYLGPSGTFTEEAAAHYIGKSRMEAVMKPYSTIEEAIEAVMSGACSEAVVPIENSIEGAVNITIDKLMFGEAVYIKALVNLPVRQNLLVPKQSAGHVPRIEKILSHPQALAQSRRFILAHYPGAEIVPVNSTAEAARLAACSGGPLAAIGTERTAGLYGLDILHRDVQESQTNTTSFVVLTKTETTIPMPGCVTSVVFSTRNEPGALYKILDLLAIWDLNLTKIVSRPLKNKPGEYAFLVDIEGYADARDVQDALTMMQRKASLYRNLGTYPVISV